MYIKPEDRPCDDVHKIRAKGPGAWTFNGDLQKPTFKPSHLTGCKNFTERRCHSFIENGMIRFLGDCHHDLKNQTVPIPAYPDWLD